MQSTTTKPPIVAAALAIAASLETGAPITRAALNAAMEAVFDAPNDTGQWTQRDSFEALEAAAALSLPGLLAGTPA